MNKRKKNIEIYRVDRELYPDSPLLDISEVWYNLEGTWLTVDLYPAEAGLYEDHLYKDRREPLLPHVEQEVALAEGRLEKDMKAYHRRLWFLASLMMEDMD